LALLVAVAAVAAAADTPRQAEARRRFLQMYPQADADGDGQITPSEVWFFRSTPAVKNAKGSQAAGDTEAFMQATYTPPAIDATRAYGPPPGKKIKLFILSGQSNMVGQGMSGELADDLIEPNDRILMFEEGKWQPLRPLRYTFGPEISLAHAIAKAWPDETIGIVKQSVGGTGVLAWHPDWTREKADLTGDGKKGNLWKALTDKVRQARQAADCQPMAFVWMQGGKDMQNLQTGKQYLANLTALVEGLRKETGEPKLPLVLGSYRFEDLPDDLSNFDPTTAKLPAGRAGAAYVLKAQFDAQAALAPARMVPLRDLERHPENVHYNTGGQLALGRLFAEAYLDLAR
jgi:hypothetical protein